MKTARVVAAAAVVVAVGVLAAVASRPAPPAATRDDEVTFTASGDFTGNSTARAVFAGIADLQPDLHLALGDLSYGATGQERAWCGLVLSALGSAFPFQLLAGNHESNGQNGRIEAFADCLPNRLPGLVGEYARQYYVDVPEDRPLVRFVMISPALTFADGTDDYSAGGERYGWTADAIDGARDAGVPWVVVGMHKPCLSTGDYACDPGPDLLNLLVDRRVDLVLMGHEHLYQRTAQLATGTGCAAIVPNTFSPDCVADADDATGKGAGTIFVTVGTGGRQLRELHPADPEAPYFVANSGLGANPTWGSLEVTVSRTALTARFVGAAGGTFTDGFRIDAPGGAPAGKLSPRAAAPVRPG